MALGGGVEELLHETKLVVPTDERGLEHPGALRAGYGRHDPGRAGIAGPVPPCP